MLYLPIDAALILQLTLLLSISKLLLLISKLRSAAVKDGELEEEESAFWSPPSDSCELEFDVSRT